MKTIDPMLSGLSAGAPRGTAAVRQAIGYAAERTGADFGYLLAQAQSESGLDPSAQARTSSAAGLYQFIDQSWLGVLKQHGAKHGYGWAADAIERRGGRWAVRDGAAKPAVMALRRDPQASALMAGEFAADNAAGLSQALGRTPRAGDLYFAHFLGLSGAKRFLRARDADGGASAAAAFPVEARANRSIFYRRSGEARSLDQVYALMARKVEGGPAPMRSQPPVRGDEVRLVAVPPSSAAPAEGLPGRIDMLRPQPRQAMLAYMMVATGLPSVV